MNPKIVCPACDAPQPLQPRMGLVRDGLMVPSEVVCVACKEVIRLGEDVRMGLSGAPRMPGF